MAGPILSLTTLGGLRGDRLLLAIEEIGAVARRSFFALSTEELVLELAIFTAKLCDLLFQLSDPLPGCCVLTPPRSGVMSQLRQPGRLEGRQVHFVQRSKHEVFHDPVIYAKPAKETEGQPDAIEQKIGLAEGLQGASPNKISSSHKIGGGDQRGVSKKSGDDGVPGAYGDRGVDPELVAGATPVEEVVGTNRCGDRANSEEKRGGSKSHTKATRKKLRALGIKPTEILRCAWGGKT